MYGFTATFQGCPYVRTCVARENPAAVFRLPSTLTKMMDLSKLVLVGLNVTMLVIHRSGNVATYIATNIEK